VVVPSRYWSPSVIGMTTVTVFAVSSTLISGSPTRTSR
jgi:hypothetical protein